MHAEAGPGRPANSPADSPRAVHPGSEDAWKMINFAPEQLRAEQRAWRLAEILRRLGTTQAEVAARMGVTQGRVSAIEHARPGATELRALAAYVEALGGRLEIIADSGDDRLAFTEPAPRQPDPPASHGPANL